MDQLNKNKLQLQLQLQQTEGKLHDAVNMKLSANSEDAGRLL
jgi:hypothetical protein